MKSKKKILLSWLIVGLWMTVIFVLSGTPSKQSTKDSRGIIYKAVETSVEATNYLGITDKHPSESSYTKYVKMIDPIFRKCMHASVYFILSLLVFYALYQTGIRGGKLYFYTLLFCFLYACSDEFHQTLVPGRSGEIRDVIIDTTGALFAFLFSYLILKRRVKKLCK